MAQRDEDIEQGSTTACRATQVSTEDMVHDRESELVNLIPTARTESMPDDPYETESSIVGAGTADNGDGIRIANDIRTRESSEVRHEGIRRSRDLTRSAREPRRARRRSYRSGKKRPLRNGS